MRRSTWGVSALVALVLALVAHAAPAAGGAAAEPRQGPARAEAAARHEGGVGVRIGTGTQRALLARGALTVRLSARPGARVRLAARVGRNGRLFAKRAVSFGKSGPRARKVRLRLTARGRKRLGACGARRVRVIARYRKGDGRRAATRTRRRLARDEARCPWPAPEPPPVEPGNSVCDPLDPAVCLQPFPNDHYTRPDPSSPTGIRLDFPREGMPPNRAGVRVDPGPINRSDGFSPGSLIVTKIRGVETPAAFENTGFVPQTDLADYDRPDQPVVVFDTATGERWPIWAELDSNPTTIAPYQAPDGVGGIGLDPSNTGPVNLIVRPARNFTPGHTYVVALRNLRDANDRPVEAQAPFRTCRDGLTTDQPALRGRCAELERDVFPELAEAGISKQGLYLAWDFTVASREGLTGRALQIRDDAFRRLGDTDLDDRSLGDSEPPRVEVTAACGAGFTDCSAAPGDGLPPQPGPNVLRYVDGFIRDVPCYLNRNGCPPGSHFEFAPDGSVAFDPSFTTDVPFRCLVPAAVDTGGPLEPSRVGIFGHGLLGSHTAVSVQAEVANRSNQTWCATNWAGFSAADIPVGVMPALSDLSNFHKLVDRMQQGFVNFMMLGRAAIHPDGLAAEPAFQLGGQPVIQPDTRLLYMGISQGAIMGAALTALEPDVDRAVLSVPGMNYSTMLRRSVDFDAYASLPGLGIWANYPDELVRPLGLGLVQILWDRGEGNGYAHALVPGAELPDTPSHEVLLQVAPGDHQVANVTAEVEARTIGAQLYAPALNPGRHWEADPFLGIPQVQPPIAGGNTMVYYDGGPPSYTGPLGQGSAVAPALNVPPRPQWGYGDDSHYYPWQSEDGWDHAGSFLEGSGIGACASGGYCYTNGWTGP